MYMYPCCTNVLILSKLYENALLITYSNLVCDLWTLQDGGTFMTYLSVEVILLGEVLLLLCRLLYSFDGTEMYSSSIPSVVLFSIVSLSFFVRRRYTRGSDVCVVFDDYRPPTRSSGILFVSSRSSPPCVNTSVSDLGSFVRR